jgi:hypothetical protein
MMFWLAMISFIFDTATTVAAVSVGVGGVDV